MLPAPFAADPEDRSCDEHMLCGRVALVSRAAFDASSVSVLLFTEQSSFAHGGAFAFEVSAATTAGVGSTFTHGGAFAFEVSAATTAGVGSTFAYGGVFAFEVSAAITAVVGSTGRECTGGGATAGGGSVTARAGIGASRQGKTVDTAAATAGTDSTLLLALDSKHDSSAASFSVSPNV
jgi:hypothetical protein